MSQWFAMQGYAGYIWSAYGVVGVILIGQLGYLRRYRIKIHQQLQRWFQEL